ncbi:hypothetical protein N9J72_02590, partial [Candidatus Gracilibacteria bacterium]|nr:hypothetical protein [Candidatus Gracilibacteria bacterium]
VHSSYVNTSGISGDFEINNDSTSTLTQSVTLNMNLAGATKMRFGNTPLERDTATFETYASTKSWNLTTQMEKKTVYAEFENASGDNVYVQDDIVFEMSPSTLWYDASDAASITEIGGNVSQWNDKSGNNYHLKQNTLTRQAQLLGTDEIEFNGTSDFFYVESLNYVNTNPLDGLLVCSVFRTNNTTTSLSGNWSLLDFDRSEWFNFYNKGANMGFSYDSNGTIRDTQTSGTSVNDNNWHVSCGSYDNSIINDTVVTIDGTVRYSANLEPNGATIGSGQQTRFGFVGDGSEAATENAGRNNIYYDGTIGEILYFDSAVSASERKTIECNLGTKWGVTISGCTTIDNSPIASIQYVPETLTSGNVVASLVNASEAITITNNGGSDNYTFTSNGSFTFEFEDIDGNAGSVVAQVDWIDDTTPVILSTNFGDDTLLPGGNHNININYGDSDSGIDISSASLELKKWNGVIAYGLDIAGTSITTNSITSSSASYGTQNLSFGKYQYIFSISDIAGNSISQTVEFYIDEPEFIINDELIDIGDLANLAASYSNTLTLIVKTVGSEFDVSMNMPFPTLEYTPESISPWGGGFGFGYSFAPYSSISTIGTNQLIENQTASININGLKNTYTYDLKLGALVDTAQVSGEYTGNIDFGILFNY